MAQCSVSWVQKMQNAISEMRSKIVIQNICLLYLWQEILWTHKCLVPIEWENDIMIIIIYWKEMMFWQSRHHHFLSQGMGKLLDMSVRQYWILLADFKAILFPRTLVVLPISWRRQEMTNKADNETSMTDFMSEFHAFLNGNDKVDNVNFYNDNSEPVVQWCSAE